LPKHLESADFVAQNPEPLCADVLFYRPEISGECDAGSRHRLAAKRGKVVPNRVCRSFSISCTNLWPILHSYKISIETSAPAWGIIVLEVTEMMYSRPSLIRLSLTALPCSANLPNGRMNGRVTRPPAKKIGDYDTWSNSLMSQQGPVSDRRRAFFVGFPADRRGRPGRKTLGW
jgi:hypothetical protein